MAGLYASARGTSVLQLSDIPMSPDDTEYNMTPYRNRGWPKLESYAAMIMVGTETETHAEHLIPKLVDVLTRRPVPVERVKTPDEFEKEIKSAEFTGHADREKVKDLYLSFYLSVGVRERAMVILEDAKEKARRRRWLLRRNAIGIGFTLSFFSCVAIIYFRATLPLSYSPLCSALGTSFVVVGGVAMALCILPTELQLVRRLAQLACLTAVVSSQAIQFLAVTFSPPDQSEIGPVILNIAASIVCALGAAMLTPLLAPDGSVISKHSALKYLWKVFRVLGFLYGTFLMLAFAFVHLPYFDVSSSTVYDIYALYSGSCGIGFSVLLRPSVRRRLQMHLTGSRIDEKASSLYALFNSMGDTDTLQQAEDSFQLLSFKHLSNSDDLPGDGQPGKTSLQGEHAALGTPNSVFVSHSWHDSRQDKWDALRRWAEERLMQRGVAPLLWLDAACVAQDEVQESLALLPLFTSGCQHFLMLVGKTYTKRLWTVVELFCFLRMGGDVDRVIVLPLGNMSGDAARTQFDTFDVKHARCAKHEDTKRMLMCIEAGFGAHRPFNDMVRRILLKEHEGAAPGLKRRGTRARISGSAPVEVAL